MNTLKNGIFYLISKFYENRIYRIYRIDLSQFSPKPLEHTEFCFELLKSNNLDINIIRQIEKMEEWLKYKLESRFKSGCICLVASDNGKVIGFNLVAFNEVFIPLISMKKKLKPHSAWSEQISVHKNYRGKGLGVQLRYRILTELHKSGIKTFYGGTLINNIPNLMLTRKIGFEEFVDVHYFKLFNNKRWRYKRIK
ncbi:MAG: N-acetyltransferase family protein [Candidatus Hodarchaeales archaeon]